MLQRRRARNDVFVITCIVVYFRFVSAANPRSLLGARDSDWVAKALWE